MHIFTYMYIYCIYNQGVNQDTLRDVIIHCDGSHFTLLRPITPPSANTGFFKVTNNTYHQIVFSLHISILQILCCTLTIYLIIYLCCLLFLE